jgi:tRNA threonylcarbamoyladenosine biosynthesis protein TsaB
VIVLAVDTAGPACAVAVWRDGTVLARRAEALTRGHAERLLPMVLEALGDAGLGFGSVDLYGVTVGPGSFTGLRVGLAAVGGMALGSGRPIVGVTSFAAAAEAVPAVGRTGRTGRTVAVALDSRRGDLFVQAFAPDRDALRPVTGPAAVAPDRLAAVLPPGPLVLAGDAAEAARAALPADADVRIASTAGVVDPGVVAALAAADAARAQADPPPPLYLRAPDATPAAATCTAAT